MYNGETFDYYVSAASSDATLLPVDERLFKIQRGKGGIGQANVWYASDPQQHSEFRNQVLEYLAHRKVTKTVKPKPGTGQPKQTDPLLRQRVEQAAVKVTTKHYEKVGYVVDSVEKDNVGWDLEAVFDESMLRIEVKGLSGSEMSVELTPNEYSKMITHHDSYRLCVVTNALTDPR